MCTNAHCDIINIKKKAYKKIRIHLCASKINRLTWHVIFFVYFMRLFFHWTSRIGNEYFIIHTWIQYYNTFMGGLCVWASVLWLTACEKCIQKKLNKPTTTRIVENTPFDEGTMLINKRNKYEFVSINRWYINNFYSYHCWRNKKEKNVQYILRTKTQRRTKQFDNR